jgi:HD superfamily phosphohydrolase
VDLSNQKVLKTIYGSLEIKENVLIELINNRVVQRLKYIDQYGTLSYYNNSIKSFSRYDHSIGVLYILKKFNATLEEQVAGLLHDASHTVFSHVGDKVFKQVTKDKAYQDIAHLWYLNQTDVPEILEKHSLDFKETTFLFDKKILKRPHPYLDADAIEYILRGGFVEGMLTKEDIMLILDDLNFDGDHWIFNTEKQAKMVGDIALYLSEHVWKSLDSCVVSSFLAVILISSMKTGAVSKRELHFSTDSAVWEKVTFSNDKVITDYIYYLNNRENLYMRGDFITYDHLIKTKSYIFNPIVKDRGVLTSVNREFNQSFLKIKRRNELGWPVIILGELKNRSEYLDVMLF